MYQILAYLMYPILYLKYIELVGWLVGFYGILTFVGYLKPNLFL